MAGLPPIPPDTSASTLRQLVQEGRRRFGSMLCDEEIAWAKAIAAHPAADVEVLRELLLGASALELSDAARAAGAADFFQHLRARIDGVPNALPATGSSAIEVRAAGDLLLARPFGEVALELPSLPVTADSARLLEIFAQGWPRAQQDGALTRPGLAWLHALATHPASSRAVRAALAGALAGARVNESVERELLHRFARGLGGELDLTRAPLALPPRRIPEPLLVFGAPRWPLPAADLDAAALGLLLDERLPPPVAATRGPALDLPTCAWLLELAYHPGADTHLCRQIAARMSAIGLDDDARAAGAERLQRLLHQGALPVRADDVALRDVRQALAFMTELLVEAAGSDRILSDDELARALQPLTPIESTAVRALYDSVAAANELVTVEALRDLVQRTTADLDRSARARLAAHEVMQLSAFGASLVNLARRLERGALFEGLEGAALQQALAEHAAGRIVLDYGRARQLLFSYVDNDDGRVKDIYTGRVITTSGIPAAEGPRGVNTEHAYPRAHGVADTPAEADLHHLFPTDAKANWKRANHPFGDVVRPMWSRGGAQLGHDASGAVVFEPPDAHKGDVARALFYLSTVYDLPLDDAEEASLRAWHRLDAVDDRERTRNERIERIQRNRNPFIDDPTLAKRINDF